MLAAVDQRRQLAVGGDHRQLGRGQSGAEGHQDDARLGGGGKGVEELEPVAGQDPEPVTAPESEGVQPRPRTGRGPVVHLAIGEALRAGHVDDRRALRRQAAPLTNDVGADHGSGIPLSSTAISGGAMASAACSTSAVLSGHSRCGTWPQPCTVWSRARGSPSRRRCA